jgi:hypothetical protein
MKIRSFVHKGPKALLGEYAKGVPADTVDKLRKMFAFLDAIQDAKSCGRLRAGEFTRWSATAKAFGV